MMSVENNEFIRKNIKEKSKIQDFSIKNETGITLIALVVTTIFCYDEFIKSSNNNGFLLQTI